MNQKKEAKILNKLKTLQNSVRILSGCNEFFSPKFGNSAGFTIFELLITIGIVSSVILGIGLLGRDIGEFQVSFSESLMAEQDAELTMKAMRPELRSMGPSSVGGYPIEQASTSSLTFFSDFDKDGIFERIRYFYGGNSLKRGITEPSGNPLVYNTSTEIINSVIRNAASSTDIFSYFDDNFTGTEGKMSSPINISSIRVIRMDITIDQPQSRPAPTSYFILETPRYLRSN